MKIRIFSQNIVKTSSHDKNLLLFVNKILLFYFIIGKPLECHVKMFILVKNILTFILKLSTVLTSYEQSMLTFPNVKFFTSFASLVVISFSCHKKIL